jgi:hypothetical protein
MFDLNGLRFNDLSRYFDAFLELRDMEDIMNGSQLRRKMNSVSHWATDFKDFEWSDISGC